MPLRESLSEISAVTIPVESGAFWSCRALLALGVHGPQLMLKAGRPKLWRKPSKRVEKGVGCCVGALALRAPN